MMHDFISKARRNIASSLEKLGIWANIPKFHYGNIIKTNSNCNYFQTRISKVSETFDGRVFCLYSPVMKNCAIHSHVSYSVYKCHGNCTIFIWKLCAIATGRWARVNGYEIRTKYCALTLDVWLGVTETKVPSPHTHIYPLTTVVQLWHSYIVF